MITVKTFTFNPLQENTYLLSNEAKEAIIIDPGCYSPAEKKHLLDYINANNLRPVQLLNTHCHIDHIFGNRWVHETFALELFLHPNEQQVLQLAPQFGQMWSLPFDNYEGPLHFLQHKDVVTFAKVGLNVLLTPGHSPGSVCFYCPEQKFVIGGDVLFRESIGRTDLPGGNHPALLQSIREQLLVLPGDVTVYPGHGEPTTIGHEKKYNPWLQNQPLV